MKSEASASVVLIVCLAAGHGHVPRALEKSYL